jgi:hypothetical protein
MKFQFLQFTTKIIIMASNSNDWSPEHWLGDIQVSHSDMNRLVMDYLVTEGYKEAAEKFSEESGVHLPSGAYSETLEARIRIRQAIHDGRVGDAITMINDLHPELLENNKILHFYLLQQQLIELIRQQRVDEALRFAQEHLAEKGEENPQLLKELERTLGLLAFERPEQSPFGDLMSNTHRYRVASDVNAAILEADHCAGSPRLESLVQLLLWAQDQLDRRQVSYPKMTDIAEATIQNFKRKSVTANSATANAGTTAAN